MGFLWNSGINRNETILDKIKSVMISNIWRRISRVFRVHIYTTHIQGFVSLCAVWQNKNEYNVEFLNLLLFYFLLCNAKLSGYKVFFLRKANNKSGGIKTALATNVVLRHFVAYFLAIFQWNTMNFGFSTKGARIDAYKIRSCCGLKKKNILYNTYRHVYSW